MNDTSASPTMSLPPLAAEVAQLIASLVKKVDGLTIENQLLRQKIEALIRLHFGGTKNEGIDPKQMDLFMAGLADLTQTPAPAPADEPAKTASAAKSAPYTAASASSQEILRVGPMSFTRSF